jgi:hypothetical protein
MNIIVILININIIILNCDKFDCNLWFFLIENLFWLWFCLTSGLMSLCNILILLDVIILNADAICIIHFWACFSVILCPNCFFRYSPTFPSPQYSNTNITSFSLLFYNMDGLIFCQYMFIKSKKKNFFFT